MNKSALALSLDLSQVLFRGWIRHVHSGREDNRNRKMTESHWEMFNICGLMRGRACLRLASSAFLQHHRNVSAIVCVPADTSLSQPGGVQPPHGVLKTHTVFQIEWPWQRSGRNGPCLPARPSVAQPGGPWKDSWSSGYSRNFPPSSLLLAV